ncbi:hypothetical protein ABPG74_006555 [Tetrahymena malaccensis]
MIPSKSTQLNSQSNQDEENPMHEDLEQKQHKKSVQTQKNRSKENPNAKGSEYFNQGMNYILVLLFVNYFKITMRLSKIMKARKYTFSDIPSLQEKEKVEYNSVQLQKKLQEIHDKKKPLNAYNMTKIIFSVFSLDFIRCITFLILDTFLRLFSSICLQKLIESVQMDDQDEKTKWVVILSVFMLLSVITGQNSWKESQDLSAKLRLSLVTILYAKVNSLSSYTIKNNQLNKIINIISKDFNIAELRFSFLFISIVSPLALAFSTYILVDRHGPMGLLIIGLMIACLPIQNLISKKAAKYIPDKNKYSDQRIKLTREIIEGINFVKMYAWEKAFIKFIKTIRSQEMVYLLKQVTYNYIAQSLSYGSVLISATVPFVLIHYFGEPNQLNTAKIFSTMQVIMFLRLQVMLFVGYGFSFMHESKIFLGRISSVITLQNQSMKNLDKEQEKQNSQTNPTNLFPSLKQNKINQEKNLQIGIQFQDFQGWWNSEGQGKPALNKLNFSFLNGQTYAIVGQVGSGKSTLLLTCLKELPSYKGHFNISGTVAYQNQESSIFPGTVRENILFGKTYEEEWYQQVADACCLISDFSQFQQSDLTQINEKASNLSGGQKARITLARAVYSKSDIYLLDDPLSAVDSKVAKLLVQNVFNNILKNKLVLLVTHQISKVKQFQNILVIQNGGIVAYGDQVKVQKELNFLQADQSLDEENQEQDQEKNEKQNEIQDKLEIPKKETLVDLRSQYQSKSNSQKAERSNNDDGEEKIVQAKTYKNFLTFNKRGWAYLFIFLVYILNEVILTGYNRILGLYDSSDIISKRNLFIALGILCFFFCITLIIKYVNLGREIIVTNSSVHSKMAEQLIHAPTVYFDKTSGGEILNRFSNDVDIMDSMIHYTYQIFYDNFIIYRFYKKKRMIDAIEGPVNFLNLMITICFIQPYFAIVSVVELIILFKWFSFNQKIIMQSKYLDLLSKTPVFSFFSQTLQGMEIVQVYGQQQNFYDKFCFFTNQSIRTNMMFWDGSRMFGMYTQFATTFSSIIGIIVLTSLSDSSTNSGLFGQSLSYLVLMTEQIYWSMRQIINTNSSMSSTQRALEICDLPTERDYEFQNDQRLLESGWPKKGDVQMKNVYMKYRRELAPTLKGLNLNIPSGVRVGCVGRTGAGKSSIIECLMNLREGENVNDQVQNNKGDMEQQIIKIDGQDISKIGLHTLRNQISITPQVPFMFSGTIRKNLDPLDAYSDLNVIQALQQVQLYDIISQLKNGLNTDIGDASVSFSVGQKQLFCLARAILKNSKIIIMDEATANMDMVTDSLIQNIISQKFKESTVITIAHRLNTIADYDYVVVMDKGTVAEYDHPFNLLANSLEDETITKNTIFSQLVLNTGQQSSLSIFKIAKSSYQNQQQQIQQSKQIS